VLTKVDVLGPDESLPEIDAPDAWASFAVSSVSRDGLSTLLEGLWKRTRQAIHEESGSGEDDPWTP
jgi:hypothetical protein